MLSVQNLSASYRPGAEVLRSLSLTLPDASVGVVLGPNGCGKTTLFRSILGIVKPTGGTVSLDGEDLLRLPRKERAARVAWVPQDIRFGALSVFDSVLSGRVARFGYRAGEEDRRAAEAAIEELGLTALSERSAEELSGGERQKVAIARALCQEPRLLILDEPTGSLDIAGEERLLRIARRLALERGMGVLCSLHDLNQALSVGDRFYFLKEGAVYATGGSECVTKETIREIYGIEVRILEHEGRKIILGGIAK